MSLLRSWHRQTPSGGGKGTLYNTQYCDAPPEKAYVFQASGTERVAGISLAEVSERVGLTDVFLGRDEVQKTFWLYDLSKFLGLCI